ncbi:MAG: DNA-binding response regulator [Ancylobacter novellus]|uniref:DNA-binding response regulator n=1 Tax=Ancylobacter novellus TaxID=921 RepID=A0A2W5KA99_ANCNO|nr:MAG: DNA-binding response regulator [Ancylobacter novellus]
MRFVIVDDHPLFREAMLSAVTAAFPDAVVDEADALTSAFELLAASVPADLILLDLSMKGVTGFDGLIEMRARFPRTPVLVVSGMDEPEIVREAIRCGAAGFVPKASGKTLLAEAMIEVLNGGVFLPKGHRRPPPGGERSGAAMLERLRSLTPAQMRVLSLVKRGKLNKQIAYELNVGESTVKAHISEIMRKLGVSSRTQAVIETSALEFNAVMSEGRGAAEVTPPGPARPDARSTP